jgi:RES domain-containing protein
MTKTMHVHDLSGTGASKFGGRWNPKGTYVLYTASSAALAMLEWLAHADERSMDESYSLATILIPDHSVEKLLLSTLPSTWKKVPPPTALADIGRKFVADGVFLALEVPSVLVPHDCSLVINSQHPLMNQVKIEAVEEIYPDKRLITKSAKL